MGEKVRFASAVTFYEKLKEGNSAQAHVKEMTELFAFLSVAGKTVSEEDV